MFVCNVMFSRTTRKPHRKRLIETHLIHDCVIDLNWEEDKGNDIRSELMKHAPFGDGWTVAGYARVKED